MTLLKILLSILILSFIVFIHELFHFLAAKLLKIKTFDFSVGMGPKLISYQNKKLYFLNRGEINPDKMSYNLRLLPFGGFVSFGRMTEDKELIDELSKQKPWKRIIVAFAGPLGNILFAILLTFILINNTAHKDEGILVYSVERDTSSYELGLKPSDIILSINDVKVNSNKELIREIEKFESEELCFSLLRNDKNVSLCSDTSKEDGKFGVTLIEPISTIDTIPLSFETTYSLTKDYITNFLSLFIDFDIKELSGPVGIVDTMQQNVTSFEKIVTLMIIINIALGIANLLFPLSITDGGKIVIDFICILFRRNNINTTYLDVICVLCMLILFIFTAFFDIQTIINRF